MKRINIGSFEVISGEVMVSDPCYEVGTWCQGKLENVLNGHWHATVLVSDEGSWGKRIAQLEVVHSGCTLRSLSSGWKQEAFEVGVDSGQAGVFDTKHYRDDKVVEGFARLSQEIICPETPWYSLCCDRTMTEAGAGTIPFGVVSSSGFGDGGYTCFTHRDADGDVVGIRIVFITEDEDDQEG